MVWNAILREFWLGGGGGGNIFVVMGWVRFGSTVGVCIYVRLGCQELRLVELGDGLGTGKGG